MYDISQDPALSPQAPACKNEIKKYLLKSTLQKPESQLKKGLFTQILQLFNNFITPAFGIFYIFAFLLFRKKIYFQWVSTLNSY